jgi:hypothetical protein
MGYTAGLLVDGSAKNLVFLLCDLDPSAIVGLSSALQVEDGVLEFEQICLFAEESGGEGV